MSPSRPLELQIPQQLVSGKRPDYEKLQIFNCKTFALMRKDECQKLNPRSQKCVFLGYRPSGNFGYQLLDPETRQVVQSSDINFNESEMHKPSDGTIELQQVTFSDVLMEDSDQ